MAPGGENSSYDYAELNRDVNKTSRVDTLNFESGKHGYDPEEGLSHNLQKLFAEQMGQREAKKHMYEVLHAVQDYSNDSGKAEFHPDRIDQTLTDLNVVGFQVAGGKLSFYDARASQILEISAVSSRQNLIPSVDGRLPEYDYGQINQENNGAEQINIHEVQSDRAPYKPERGLSFNLRALFEKSMDAKQAKAYMFEALHAVQNYSEEINDTALHPDFIDETFTRLGIVEFNISEGELHFYDENGEVLIHIPVLSSRQEVKRKALKEALRLKYDIDEDEIERRQRVKRAREAVRTAREAVGPPDNSLAIKVRLPAQEIEGEFFTSEAWIGTKEIPEVLPQNVRGETACSPYVAQWLTKALGGDENLRVILDGPFLEGFDAWDFKRRMLRGGHVEHVEGMQDYVGLREYGTFRKKPTESPAYRSRLTQFSEQANRLVATGSPVIMNLYYEHSSYKHEVARENFSFNLGRHPEYRSLNSHVTYALGRGFRRLGGSPARGEKAGEYVRRALHIKAAYLPVLQDTRIRVNGGTPLIYNEYKNLNLAHTDKVELEDIYFAHQYNGSKVHSMSELLGNGSFIPTDILRVKTEDLDQDTLPNTELPEGVRLAKNIYLHHGQNIKDLVINEIGPDRQDYAALLWFWRDIGFDDRKTDFDIDPIPIPNMDSLWTHIKAKGGLAKLELENKKIAANEYMEEHPDEHLIFVEYVSPWETLEPYFDRIPAMDGQPPFTQEEIQMVLAEVDQLNSDIDLRTFKRPQYDIDGEIYGEVNDFVRWQNGNMIWLNNEVIKTIEDNIYRKRVEATIHIPDTLTVAVGRDILSGRFKSGSIEVQISQHHKDMIKLGANHDQDLALALTTILCNEELAGSRRREVAEWLDDNTAFNEGSVGLFQVAAVKEDREWVENVLNPTLPEGERYEFINMEDYRMTLRDDDKLNARVAGHRLKESRHIYDYNLRRNGETPNHRSSDYMASMISMYNRPSKYVYMGTLSYNASSVMNVFEIDNFNPFHPEPALQSVWTPSIAVGEKADEYLKITGRPSQHPLAEYAWTNIARSLDKSGDISVSEEEVREMESYIQNNIPKFLTSSAYLKIREAYTQRITTLKAQKDPRFQNYPDDLSLILDRRAHEKHAIANYGLRGTRYGQVESILEYSAEINAEFIEENKVPELMAIADIDNLPLGQVM